jgi:hypothetical protein
MTRRARGTTRRQRRSLRVAAAGLLAGSLLATTSASAATSLRDTFESGAPSGWSEFSSVTVGGAYARSGSYGARAVSTQDKNGYLGWTRSRVTQGQRYARISGWIKLASFRSGETVSMLIVRNARGVNHFNMWRDRTTGRLRYDLYRGDSARSTMRADVGRWYFIEVLVDYGENASTTYTARVRVNGATQPTVRSTGQVGSTVRAAYFGDTVRGKTSTRHYDNLALTVSDSALYFTR